ncbi:NAD-dependent epimerase/dehydratase family protein [Sulfurimonas sp.]|uniref:NAD-dependent epimerase/dehydratase family protein n=1 Tax=Sulfurimonas sp. TaxID=2022749 RepID=UPI00261E8C86|nr:NAD-dependent epimerase/dehydratase family protein [Sulfurimonas sp.]MCW8895358.1 sugar nucleotide-binding protein [Sulfurimonas sp.]MCW9067501.1 sugar nucleotide-binding protein [Sulfurimonas sp.]
MNILLTGSNGFVGSYFISKYSEKYNIKTFSFLNNNFVDLDFNNIDTVVHLSALVHQMGGADQEEYEKVNVTQTINLAKKAKENGVMHFIFMSTVKVYGEETNIAYKENSRCKPEDEYGKSKLKAEKELQKLEDDDFTVSIIRTPIVYGYGVKANIKNLMSLVKKVSILPFANIKNKRSMVYVGNLCHLIDIIIQKQINGIYLASDDKPLSTTELIEFIAKELNKKVYLVKIPLFKEILKLVKPSFYKRLYESLEVDNRVTKERLSHKNLYSVDDGIRFMIHGEK